MKELYLELYNDIKDNYEHIIKDMDFFLLKKAYYPDPNQSLDRYFNKNGIRSSIETYIDINNLCLYARPKINKFKSTRKIFDYIIDNDLSPFKKMPFDQDIRSIPSVTKNLIADFFGRMLFLSGNKLILDDSFFDVAFSELNAFLYSDKLKYKLLVNLYGPHGDVDDLIMDNAIIKKADYDIAKLFCYYYSNSELYIHEMLENDYYIEIEMEMEKNNWEEISFKEEKVIENVFNCLVISQSGNIELGKKLRISSAWPIIKTEKINYNPIQNKYGENNLFRYVFDEKSKYILKENSIKLRTVDYKSLDYKIKASFSRLKKSKSTMDIEDKIIELVLCIEYLINTANYEVTLQLCLKIIKIYKESNQDKTIFKLLKDFFDLRGDIVHGKKEVLATPKNVKIIQEVESIIIDILSKYMILNSDYSFADINEAIKQSLYIDKSVFEILETIKK